MGLTGQLIVQKYGGTSVGTPEKIIGVAKRIRAAISGGAGVVVVVSAMGHTTDELLELASTVTPNHFEREIDMLLSAGERISMALLSMALKDQGVSAISFTGSQAGIITDESHTRARILEIRPMRVLEELKRGKVVIVAGFQGVSRTKEITTLGRGGSDTTAVALAAALKADRCEILTDVKGIYSADPRVVENPSRFQELSLDLVSEMSTFGAQVMQPRSIEIARRGKFPIYVGLAHGSGCLEEEGTMLVPLRGDEAVESPKAVAITSKQGLVQFLFGPEMVGPVLSELAASAVPLHAVREDDEGNLTVVVHGAESKGFLAKYGAKIQKQGLGSVTVIGYSLHGNPMFIQRIREILASHQLQSHGLTSHSQSITVWLTEEDCKGAVKALHRALIEEVS